MRDLAAATDMSLAGMYYYVRGKEELLFRIQERCFMRVLAGAQRALVALGDADPGERLQAFIQHHVTFFAAHMAEMKVLSHEATSLTGERQRKVNAIKRRYVDLLEELLKDAATGLPPVGHNAHSYMTCSRDDCIYNWYVRAGASYPDPLA